ncbi:MAG: PilT/PilU family type 4a pilus ATPase [Planctomycetota bacterium]|nr:PilT/PilU family type 4a pilus ATPase [Planctomycetota bacterium]
MEENLFGSIVLKNGLVTQEQLDECVTAQKRIYPPKKLGEIMVERGHISDKTLASILSVQRRQLRTSGKAASQVTTGAIATRLQNGKLVDFLQVSAELEASDLYILTGARPVVRINGHLIDLETEVLDARRVKELIAQILPPESQRFLVDNKQIDLSYNLEGVARYRGNIFKHTGGYDALFRLIPYRIRTIEELGLPRIIERFTKYSRGIVLITGPTGSGKSTTMAALVERINRERKEHVITVEDPIEYVFEPKKCTINQRQVPNHAESFSRALRAALREDPDVIVVGEMRDLETISIAITAAETGHLVLATLHTSGATRTINRILDAFPIRQQAQIRGMLAGSLRGVISQLLIPSLDGGSRHLALEVMVSTPAVATMIRDERTYQIPFLIQTGKQYGMKLMDDSLIELVHAKKISFEEAYLRCDDKDKIMNMHLVEK